MAHALSALALSSPPPYSLAGCDARGGGFVLYLAQEGAQTNTPHTLSGSKKEPRRIAAWALVAALGGALLALLSLAAVLWDTVKPGPLLAGAPSSATRTSGAFVAAIAETLLFLVCATLVAARQCACAHSIPLAALGYMFVMCTVLSLAGLATVFVLCPTQDADAAPLAFRVLLALPVAITALIAVYLLQRVRIFGVCV